MSIESLVFLVSLSPFLRLLIFKSLLIAHFSLCFGYLGMRMYRNNSVYDCETYIIIKIKMAKHLPFLLIV